MDIYKVGSRGATVKAIQRALNLYPDGIFGRETEYAVKDFQRRHKLIADGIVGVKTMALLFPKVVQTKLGLKKSRRQINEIIVHCTATPEGKDYTVMDVRRWHRQRGWSDIGYHYLIYRNGHVEPGRNVDTAGAHCEGHNLHSIGICYVGGLDRDGKNPKDTRTLQQKAALLSLLMDLRKLYPDAEIHGHRDFANKACPSFDATREYRKI